MKRQFSLFKWITLLPLIVLYNNCDGFKSVDAQKVSGSSTCKLSVRSSLKLAQFSPNECQNFSDIVCEKRIFSPDPKTNDSVTQECFKSSLFGTQCLEVLVRKYDTTVALGEPEDFLKGGIYNYEEVNCYNKKWHHNSEAIFKTSADTLIDAVDQLYETCRQGGEK